MNQSLNKIKSLWNRPMQKHDIVEVVLEDAGIDPKAVAHVLQQVLSLTLRNPEALRDAMPLVLYEELEWPKAERLIWKLRLAGADVTIRNPRERYLGIRRSFFSRRAA